MSANHVFVRDLDSFIFTSYCSKNKIIEHVFFHIPIMMTLQR